MAIEHVDIVDPEIHEPKGIAAAAVNQVYLADGAGSGNWQLATPHIGVHFTDFATPYSLALTTSYQLLAVTTTTHASAVGFTGASGRLTYTGTYQRHLHMVFDCSFDQSTGSAKDFIFAWYKNGVLMTGAETQRTTTSGDLGVVAAHWDDVASTGDYYELWAKASASATINIGHFYLFINGMTHT